MSNYKDIINNKRMSQLNSLSDIEKANAFKSLKSYDQILIRRQYNNNNIFNNLQDEDSPEIKLRGNISNNSQKRSQQTISKRKQYTRSLDSISIEKIHIMNDYLCNNKSKEIYSFIQSDTYNFRKFLDYFKNDKICTRVNNQIFNKITNNSSVYDSIADEFLNKIYKLSDKEILNYLSKNINSISNITDLNYYYSRLTDYNIFVSNNTSNSNDIKRNIKMYPTIDTNNNSNNNSRFKSANINRARYRAKNRAIKKNNK